MTGSGFVNSPAQSLSISPAKKSVLDAITRVLAKKLGVEADSRELNQRRGNGTRGRSRGRRDRNRECLREAKDCQDALGRIGRPLDIAPIAMFLASDESRWLTGGDHFGLRRPT